MAYDKEKAKKKAIENENNAREILKGIKQSYHENPERIAEVFAFASNFYNYSPKNTQLIYAQNPYATFCQSFKDWKDLKAPVKSGEHGYKIWVPVRTTLLKVAEDEFIKLSDATEKQKQDYKEGKIESYIKNHFAIGTVFDISQTTFPKERYPEIYSMGFSSEEHALIYQGIKEFSEEVLDCPVSEKELESISLRGYCVYGAEKIVINSLLEDTGKLSTCAHELGHAMMEHSASSSESQKEVEADAMGIMLQTTFGISIDETRKRHFVNHYKNLEKEIVTKYEDPAVVDEELETKIDEIFDNVYRVYRDNIDQIQERVNRYLPQEQHIQKEKEKMISQEKSSVEKETALQRAMRGRSEAQKSSTLRKKEIEL